MPEDKQPDPAGNNGSSTPDPEKWIPKARLDEEIGKRVAAEQRGATADAAERAARVNRTARDLLRAGVDLDDASIEFGLSAYDTAHKNVALKDRPQLAEWMKSDAAPVVLRGAFHPGAGAGAGAGSGGGGGKADAPTQKADGGGEPAPKAPPRPPPPDLNAGAKGAPPPPASKLTPAEVRRAARDGGLDRLVRKA